MIFGSCDTNPTADEIDSDSQEKIQKEGSKEVGMPGINHWTEKKEMKMIYEARDNEKLICYAYLANEMNGKVGQYLGKCIGYGLPYATQYSNPQKQTWHTNGGWVTLPQAEPNGLFMPASADATWLFMIDPATGTPHPVYFEPKVIVSPFPLTSS